MFETELTEKIEELEGALELANRTLALSQEINEKNKVIHDQLVTIICHYDPTFRNSYSGGSEIPQPTSPGKQG